MKLWPLAWAALGRKPAAVILVCLAVTAAFTLLGLMLGLDTTYRRIVNNARQDRLYVNARFPTATGVKMPIAMREEIARIPGVTAVNALDTLVGYYQDPHNVGRIRAMDQHTPHRLPQSHHPRAMEPAGRHPDGGAGEPEGGAALASEGRRSAAVHRPG